MSRPMRSPLLQGLIACGLSLLLVPAFAGCLRVLVAPASAIARDVVVKEKHVSGALVDFLHRVGRQSACEFHHPVLPRARLDRMFFSDEVDVLFPASRNSARDRSATFVPWFRLHPQLVTVRWNTEQIHDLRELMARPAWTAVVVRSFSWGDAYDSFIQELDRQGRVTYVAELRTVHAMLRAGHARFTLLPPSLLYASLPMFESAEGPSPSRPVGLPADFAYHPLPDLPPIPVGMYLNPRRIAPDDIERLIRATQNALADGVLQRSLARYYPPALLTIDMKATP